MKKLFENYLKWTWCFCDTLSGIGLRYSLKHYDPYNFFAGAVIHIFAVVLVFVYLTLFTQHFWWTAIVTFAIYKIIANRNVVVNLFRSVGKAYDKFVDWIDE